MRALLLHAPDELDHHLATRVVWKLDGILSLPDAVQLRLHQREDEVLAFARRVDALVCHLRAVRPGASAFVETDQNIRGRRTQRRARHDLRQGGDAFTFCKVGQCVVVREACCQLLQQCHQAWVHLRPAPAPARGAIRSGGRNRTFRTALRLRVEPADAAVMCFQCPQRTFIPVRDQRREALYGTADLLQRHLRDGTADELVANRPNRSLQFLDARFGYFSSARPSASRSKGCSLASRGDARRESCRTALASSRMAC